MGTIVLVKVLLLSPKIHIFHTLHLLLVFSNIAHIAAQTNISAEQI